MSALDFYLGGEPGNSLRFGNGKNMQVVALQVYRDDQPIAYIVMDIASAKKTLAEFKTRIDLAEQVQ